MKSSFWKKHIRQSFFLFVTLSLIMLCLGCQGQSGTQNLNPDAFQSKLNATSARTLLDVRTQSEYNKGHLPESVCIDYYGSDFKSKVSGLDKNLPVFVYCAAGPRSESASKILLNMGFKEVYNLKGGFNAWSKENRPVEQ